MAALLWRFAISKTTRMAEEATSQPTQQTEANNEPYTWSQALPEATVTIPIPANIKSRDLVVEIKKEHLLVKIKADPKPLIDGPLHKPVKAHECFWNIGMLFGRGHACVPQLALYILYMSITMRRCPHKI